MLNNGISELASMLKARENNAEYSPVFGTIISLPDVQIQIGGKIVIDASLTTSLIDLCKIDGHGDYIYLNKTVVMLPYDSYQRYIVLGVVV